MAKLRHNLSDITCNTITLRFISVNDQCVIYYTMALDCLISGASMCNVNCSWWNHVFAYWSLRHWTRHFFHSFAVRLYHCFFFHMYEVFFIFKWRRQICSLVNKQTTKLSHYCFISFWYKLFPWLKMISVFICCSIQRMFLHELKNK